MIARIVLLITASLAFTVLTSVPARHYWGDAAFVHCVTAMAICLVPAVLTLMWAHWALSQDPQQTPVLILGGSGLRMFGVLLIALVLHLNVPLFHDQTFLFWVLAAYLFVLTVEVWLLVYGRHRVEQTQPGKPDV